MCGRINTAGKIPVAAVRINRDLVRDGSFNAVDMERILQEEVRSIRSQPLVELTFSSSLILQKLTSGNRTELVLRHALTIGTPPDFGHRYGPCAAVHPTLDSCRQVPMDRFISVFRWMLPIYGALHFIPMMLFKRKGFIQEPLKMLLRAGWGTTRSAAFLGTFVVIYQCESEALQNTKSLIHIFIFIAYFCFKHYMYEILLALRQSPSSIVKPPMWLIKFLISKPSFWMGGLLSGLSLFVEARRRRGELAMYVLPKGLESVWVMARGKGLVFRTGDFGEALVCLDHF